MTRWIGVAVDTSIPWPASDTTVSYHGQTIHFRAATDTTMPMLDVAFGFDTSPEQAELLLRRFMSALAWMESARLRATTSITADRRVALGRPLGSGITINQRFRADHLPEPSDPKAQLALAIYREAMGLNSIPYQFLSYFKVLNVLHASGPAQKAWIRRVLPSISDAEANQRLAALSVLQPDVAAYLYESGRCAVAHAFAEPVVDPDDPGDERRLKSDLPVIRALARYLLEHEYGVRSRETVLREHLYELDGFRQIFGGDATQVMKLGGTLEEKAAPSVPLLSIRLRDHAKFPTLEALQVDFVARQPGAVVLSCQSQAAPLRLSITLSFFDERLGFDPTMDVVLEDNGSADAVQARIDHRRLILGLVKNGELEIWTSSDGKLLGRRGPHIPVDIDMRRTCSNLEQDLVYLEAELALRRTPA